MFCEIRELNSSDLDELLKVLNQDLYTHLFIASKSSEVLSQKSSSTVFGYFEDGKLVSGLMYSSNFVPFNLTQNAASEFGKFLANLTNRCASIVGPKNEVELLWSRISPLFPLPRLIRESQTLYVLEDVLPDRTESNVRKAEIEDLDSYTSASFEMFAGEVGTIPLDMNEYKSRVRAQITAGHSYGWFAQDGRTLFKVDIGSIFNGTCQLQGVWLHPQLRGRGFSSELLHNAINLIQSEFAQKITLYVNDFNEPAIALYEHLGFKEHNKFQTIFF